jgi:hypothetical protein
VRQMVAAKAVESQMPYQLIAGGVIVVIAFFGGWKVNGWRMDAAQKKADEVELRATQAATEAAVTAIKGIEVKYVTIKQQGETITREVPVYRDCLHSTDGLRVLNEALTGAADSAVVLPGPDATR